MTRPASNARRFHLPCLFCSAAASAQPVVIVVVDVGVIVASVFSPNAFDAPPLPLSICLRYVAGFYSCPAFSVVSVCLKTLCRVLWCVWACVCVVSPWLLE